MGKKITVVGSFVVDLMGRAPHLAKPGETVKGNLFKMGPGGKGANQAVAAKRAGANVEMITKVGKDEFGTMAINNFKKEGFNTELILVDEELATGAALILVDENTSENMISVHSGACDNITEEDLNKVRSEIVSSDIVLLQLEINKDAIEKTIKWAKEEKKFVILNPAPVQEIEEWVYKSVDIITPNEVEASILTGVTIENVDDARKAAEVFMNRGVKNVVITLGSKGVYIKNSEIDEHIGAFKVEAIDTTGAGDAFNGGFVAALSEGKDLIESARFGSAVAALSVTKMGTAPAMPYREETDDFLLNNK